MAISCLERVMAHSAWCSLGRVHYIQRLVIWQYIHFVIARGRSLSSVCRNPVLERANVDSYSELFQHSDEVIMYRLQRVCQCVHCLAVPGSYWLIFAVYFDTLQITL